MRSAETRPSKRMLVGSITFSSSLPTEAVSPADTLRSLTTPSNGARTSGALQLLARQRRRGCGPRPVRSRRCCGALRRRPWPGPRSCRRCAGSSCARPGVRPGPAPGSAARAAASAEFRLSRIAVSSSLTSTSPRLTTSPFSFSTCSTTADTSARRSALRSGWIEPVMTGPEASELLCTVSRSSGDTSSLTGGLASLPSLPLAAPGRCRRRLGRFLGFLATGDERRCDGKDKNGFAQHCEFSGEYDY